MASAPDFTGATRAEAERLLARAFAAAALDDPRREARLLLRLAEAVAPAAWLIDPDQPIQHPDRAQAYASRRLNGEPLSRIAGRREFWSLPFALSPAVLDPRPDTETLVEAALAAFAHRRDDALNLLDFGVGSGAILAALLSEWPNATGIGVDKSAEAAALAQSNLAALGLGARGQILVSDWDSALGEARFDCVVSNPPYIRSGDIAGLEREVREHDPPLALDGGSDGLDAYRALGPILARRLAPTGWFAVEFGLGQGPEVLALLAASGLSALRLIPDLTGRERVIIGGA